MKSIVVPVRSESKNNHKELYYAIRGFQRHLNNIGDIFVVSDKEIDLEGLKFIYCKDDPELKYKERNIYRKILAACNDDRVTEDFILCNDDQFLLADFDSDNLPFYYKEELYDTMMRNNNNYRKSLNHTRKHLMKNNKPTLDFDTHFPIVYNKKKFITTFESINWNIDFGFVIKSLYCGMNDIQGEYGGDCKIHGKMTYQGIKDKIQGKKFFSTSDASMNDDMIRVQFS